MYKTIYNSTFKDLNDNEIGIEILKNTNQVVKPQELVLSSDSVTIEYQGNENVFHPLKCSGCRISVLTEELLTDLFSGKPNEISCKIYRNGSLFWYGFITPNIYNSDFVNQYNKLELEFVDVISSLANYNYAYITGVQTISSFFDIIVYMLDKVDTDKVITDIYVQNSRELNKSTELLKMLLVNERNFFDEGEESEKCKDVFEYIASYLGMTLLQWKNAFYFVDYESMNLSKHTDFIRYPRKGGNVTQVKVDAGKIDLNKNVFKANASISLHETYNKIVVIGNNNPVEAMVPNLLDDEDLVNQNKNQSYYNTSHATVDGKAYTLLTAFYKSRNNWMHKQADGIKELTSANVYSSGTGSWWQRVAHYAHEDGMPSSLSWKNYFTMKNTGGMYSDSYSTYFRLNKKHQVMLKGGYFIIDMKYRLSKHSLAHDALKTSDDKFFSDIYNGGFDDTWFPCHLSIGNFYYDGQRWVNKSEYALKVQRGYYNNVSVITMVNNPTWYYYIDKNGYKRFVTKAEWNGLPGNVSKMSGMNKNVNKSYYFSNVNSERVFVNEEYYYECILHDRFLLVHKNKADDKIFDTDKTLTNTVSYTYNLAEPTDGIAIKLPDNQIMNGLLELTIYGSNHIGVYPCPSQTGQSEFCPAVHISDFVFKYTTENYEHDLFNSNSTETDSKYENIIDTDNVSTLNDIELRVNTHNPQAGSYSYVVCRKGDGYDYVGNVKNKNTNREAIAEEHIINKYHSYYSQPRFIYNNTVREADRITPLTIFHEDTLNRDFMSNSMRFDLTNNSVDLSTNEI